MLYGLYMIFTNILFPMLRDAGIEMINEIGPIVIILIGISLIFGFSAAGRLASSVANGTLNVLTVCVSAFFRAIVAFLSWFFRLIPNTFAGVREFFLRRGGSRGFSTIMAFIATVVVIAVIV